ncbi:small glutamine-rich tetratricopeptide repeat-containing protein alpha isoform X2 [Xyrichtys novacula]|uniref:Small glutamine-rich tetratricopeptide repeat-containing protein alpha n=1 Tax=Xyrichtys novacula TaxID=13765 RepID=A0AAV1FEU9_XYRNO|nr:small glutamine-rich tetratricopeptide repeat-containing protein alpha isoform X2 [Xyrichtys novacula]
MTDNKRLAFSIIQFLHDQLQSGNLTSGAQESLEVAVQCLETAFEVSTDDQSLAVPMTLPEIFASATAKLPAESQVNNNSTQNSLTEEQRTEAETLKTEGNDQMKVENFGAAVEFYSKAIAINPQNAVYYCNRAAAYSKLGNYAGAVQDCEQAISIDPNYSKAYGRMGLALASLNKHTEAASYYKKALELDPDNDTYKTNLKIAEEKMETSSPTAGMGGVDLAGLLSNPGFMNMDVGDDVRSVRWNGRRRRRRRRRSCSSSISTISSIGPWTCWCCWTRRFIRTDPGRSAVRSADAAAES